MQSERCQQCGLPVWICHNEDSDIDFTVEEDTCFAKRRIQEHESSGQKVDKKTRANWGVSARPTPKTYSKRALDLEVRDAYYEAQWKKSRPEEASVPES